MKYWLLKTEPGAFSIEDLAARPNQTEPWDGVRNYQARNMLRDEMQQGDMAFFYHSNCPEPGIVGIVQIAGPGRPDPTAFDPDELHYDPKSEPTDPRWYLVDVQLVRKLARVIPLTELKHHPRLEDMLLLRRGNRLSVMPVDKAHWDFILELE
jgi:predicted RNA-binding protein with PUA-like domain